MENSRAFQGYPTTFPLSRTFQGHDAFSRTFQGPCEPCHISRQVATHFVFAQVEANKARKEIKGERAYSFSVPSVLHVEMVRTLSPLIGSACGTLVAEQMSAKTSLRIEFKKKKIDNYLVPAAGLVFPQLLLMDYIYQRPQLLALFFSWIPWGLAGCVSAPCNK